METTGELPTNRLNLPTVSEVLEEAFSSRQNKADLFARVSKEKVICLIEDSINMIGRMESVASYPSQERLLPQAPQESQKIKAIWVLSGPGDYFHPQKEDDYKDKPWAKWMDRSRDMRAAWLARRITEIRIGLSLPRNPEVIKQSIAEYGPWVIYDGREDEKQAISQALINKEAIVPAERVFIIGKGIRRKTTDQIKEFVLPKGVVLNDGDEVALVTHAPHALRVLHMIQRIAERIRANPGLYPDSPFHGEVILRVSPVVTPSYGLKEYSIQEINGLLHYIYYDKTQPASETAYPCQFRN